MKGNEERIITGTTKDESDRKHWRDFSRSSGKRSLSCITAAAFCALSIISPVILAIPGIPGGVTALAEEADGAAMGRYMETEIVMPEGIADVNGYFEIQDMIKTEEGKLRIAVISQEGYGLWDSGDGGDTWENAVVFPEEYQWESFSDITLDPKGGGVGLIFGITEAGDIENRYVSFDAQGEFQEGTGEGINENVILNLWCSPQGQIIGRNNCGVLFNLDRTTGDVLSTFSAESVVVPAFYNGEMVTVADSKQIQRFDIESGEPLGRDEILEAALYSETDSYVSRIGVGGAITFTEEGERLYYCNASGIYSCKPGGSVVEQIVNGSLNLISDPECSKISMAVIDDVFYVAYYNDGNYGILKYEYDENISSVPGRELTIYSLEENQGIRQIAIMFQKKNPDFYVNYQIGVTGEDGITAADALRILNTEILTGNGPDILVLDGMSVDTYEEKGLLEDLSDILAELQESEGFLENIAYTYQKEETVPAVPAKFGIPVAVGTGNALEQLNDVQNLVELAKNKGTLEAAGVVNLINNLYYIYCGDWEKEDRTMDQEKLEEYLQVLRQVYENFCEGADEIMLADMNDMLEERMMEGAYGISGYAGTMGPNSKRVYAGIGELSLGVLAGMIDYYEITSVNLETGDCGVELLNGQQSEIYLPICTVGILNTSKDAEGARELVKYMLSAEGELANGYAGFSTNKKAFYEELHERESGEDFGMTSFSYGTYSDEIYELLEVWPTEEELTWLTETAESLTNPAIVNRVQEEVIKEDARRCMLGEISVEEAVDSIMQKINLYLAE